MFSSERQGGCRELYGEDPAVLVWDLASKVVRQINIEKFPHQSPRTISDISLLHIVQDEEVLVVFQVNWNLDPPEVQKN